MSRRTITIEDLYKIASVSQPRISPDGQRVAYVVTTIDERKHEYRSAIWMISTAGGEARRLTSEPANASNPVWSPDGRWLAFISERAGRPVERRLRSSVNGARISRRSGYCLPMEGKRIS